MQNIRGFTEDEIDLFVDRFRLKYDPRQDRLVIPIIDRTGVVVNMIGRAINPNNKLKYFNYYPNLSNYLGGEFQIEGRSKLSVCEGFFDALSLYRCREDLDSDVVFSAKSFLSPGQLERIIYLDKPCYLWYDPDTAGQIAINEAEKSLRPYGILVRKVKIPEGKDPGNLSISQILSCDTPLLIS